MRGERLLEAAKAPAQHWCDSQSRVRRRARRVVERPAHRHRRRVPRCRETGRSPRRRFAHQPSGRALAGPRGQRDPRTRAVVAALVCVAFDEADELTHQCIEGGSIGQIRPVDFDVFLEDPCLSNRPGELRIRHGPGDATARRPAADLAQAAPASCERVQLRERGPSRFERMRESAEEQQVVVIVEQLPRRAQAAATDALERIPTQGGSARVEPRAAQPQLAQHCTNRRHWDTESADCASIAARGRPSIRPVNAD